MQRYGFDKDFSSIDTMISEEELNLVFSSQRASTIWQTLWK